MHHLLTLTCVSLLATIVASESSHQWPWARPQTRKNDTSAVGAMKEIKGLLIDVEKKMQRFCRTYSSRFQLEAMYDTSYYKLRADLSDCDNDDLDVRAGQRLVAVQSRSCDYHALRLLPDVVDGNSAFWTFKNGELTILFPYSMPKGHCGRVFSNSVHSLPKLDDDMEYPDIDVRFKDVAMEKAFKEV